MMNRRASAYVLDKGTVHASGGMERDHGNFPHTPENSPRLKTCELSMLGIFHLQSRVVYLRGYVLGNALVGDFVVVLE